VSFAPLDVAARETETFVVAELPVPPARVLEVGAGAGRLAALLRARRFDVTAIDRSDEAVARARELGHRVELADFLDYAPERPHDAVVFAYSLHHLRPLEAALARARACLVPGGFLIVEEFAWEAADEKAMAWLAARRAELVRGGAIAASTPARWPDEPRAALEAWTRHHRDEHGVHTGATLEAAVAAAFEGVAVEEAPHLYRESCRDAVSGDRAVAAAAAVLEAERRAISGGEIPALGLRLVARARR
jgi:SAM-dependent methyltransferase